MMDADDTILDGASSGETRSSESAQPPDFAKARGELLRLATAYCDPDFLTTEEAGHAENTVRSALSAAESRLSLLEAQNAELRASQRRLTTMFEEEAYHRMSAECEVARLKGGGGVTIVMHEDKEGA